MNEPPIVVERCDFLSELTMAEQYLANRPSNIQVCAMQFFIKNEKNENFVSFRILFCGGQWVEILLIALHNSKFCNDLNVTYDTKF